MRQFYEIWSPFFAFTKLKNEISPSVTGQLQSTENQQDEISPSVTGKLDFEISQTLTGQFMNYFTSVSFTSHIEVIMKTKNIEERIFYPMPKPLKN